MLGEVSCSSGGFLPGAKRAGAGLRFIEPVREDSAMAFLSWGNPEQPGSAAQGVPTL